MGWIIRIIQYCEDLRKNLAWTYKSKVGKWFKDPTTIAMHLTNALVLLSVAICASAQSCASCPHNVGSDKLMQSCVSEIGHYTICSWVFRFAVISRDFWPNLFSYSQNSCVYTVRTFGPKKICPNKFNSQMVTTFRKKVRVSAPRKWGRQQVAQIVHDFLCKEKMKNGLNNKVTG